MIMSWDLMLHIIVASFLAGHAFNQRAYWFSLMFLVFVGFAVVAAIGSGS